MMFVVVAVSIGVVLVSFGLLPVVAAWMELLVAGSVGSCSACTAVLASQVLVSARHFVRVLSFYSMFLDCFVRNLAYFLQAPCRV